MEHMINVSITIRRIKWENVKICKQINLNKFFGKIDIFCFCSFGPLDAHSELVKSGLMFQVDLMGF